MKLENFIIETLNIKKNDLPKFYILFWHCFAVYIFISIYFVPAVSVFVHNFGSEFIPVGFIGAGITGYLASLLYSELQKRVHVRTLFLSALIFMTFLAFIFRALLGIVDEKILSFLVFIWAWPIISLSNIEMGGLAISLLNLRQVKRLFGLINIGGIISSIISYFAIPLISPYLSHTYDLLYIAIPGNLIAIVLVIYIYKRFSDETSKEAEKRTDKAESSFKELLKERYFLLIFTSAAISMVSYYFIDFGYLSAIKEQKAIFNTPEKVSNFIAIVCGFFKIGELIMSYFCNRLLSRYGIKMGLTILPFVTTGIVIAAGISSMFIGTASLLFFCLVVLNKSIERILRRGLDDPSFNILYQPLAGKIKLAVQAKTGVIQQLSTGIAGLLLMGISYLLTTSEGFQLKYFSFIFAPLLIGWCYVASSLFLEYKKRLRQILADKSKGKKKESFKYSYGDEILKKKLKKLNTDVVKLSVTILSETNPKILEPYAASLLEHEHETIKKGILRNIDPSWRKRIQSSADKIAKTDKSEEIRELALQAFNNLELNENPEADDNTLELLVNSPSVEDKLTVIKYLTKKRRPGDEKFITQLLDFDNHNVKTSSIELVPRRNSAELNAKIIKLLMSDEFNHMASNALLDMGDKVLPDMEKLFIEKVVTNVLLRVVETWAKMGSIAAKALLLKYLNYPNREVQHAIIHGLYFCRFQANGHEIGIIRKKLEETIDNTLWIYASHIDLESQKNTLKLVQSIDIERETNLELIFQLLSFLHDPKVINLIKKNIIGENTIFALEIIDNFIAQDIKQLIIPIFDDISKNQKLKKLHYLFPQLKLNLSERLKEIITRDFYKVDPWTIAKAIEVLGKSYKKKLSADDVEELNEEKDPLELWTRENVNKLLVQIRKSEMPDEIFACLWHPEEIVYTTAAQIIYEENPSRCINYMKGLSPKKQDLILLLESGEKGDNQMLAKKVKLIKKLSLFFSIPENLLVKLAKILTVLELKKGDKLTPPTLDSDTIFFIVNGKLAYKKGEPTERLYNSDDVVILGLNTPKDLVELEIVSNSFILMGNRYEYFNILADEIVIIHSMFEMIQVRK